MAVRNLRARLARRFSNRPSVAQTAAGAQALPATFLRQAWIVGRGLCIYRCEDFAQVPRARRPAACALRIPVWSPFANTGHHCVWAGAAAMVWMWDADQVAAAKRSAASPAGAVGMAGLAGLASKGRVLPETVFHAKKPDGVHQQCCVHGVELQHWRGGVLRDSYWMPAEDAARGAWFAAGADGDPPAAAVPARLASTPWASAAGAGEWLRAHERALAAFGLGVVATLACWQEARVWKVAAEAAAIAAESDRQQTSLAPALEARAELRRRRNRAQALAALLGSPSQAELMNVADAALPAGVGLHQWRYQRGKLLLTLTGEALDPVACVEGLSAAFDDVVLGRAQRGGRIDISMTVRQPAPGVES